MFKYFKVHFGTRILRQRRQELEKAVVLQEALNDLMKEENEIVQEQKKSAGRKPKQPKRAS